MQYVTVETTDISEYLDSGFYEHVSYKENTGLGMPAIVRWLGVSHRFTGLMSYWILPKKETVILRMTVHCLASI